MASDIPAADAAELYNQRLTIGVVVTCLSLSLITFTLRIYARVVTSAKLWWDDYWMFLVMVLCLAMSAADFVGLAYGSGRHQADLPLDDLLTFMKNLWVYMLLWACGVFTVKVGILLFYWRVFHTRGFRIGALAVGAFSTGIFLSNFFSFTFQCIPISKFWDPAGPGECFDQNSFYLASAIINVLGDVAVLSLPLPVVWNLNTSKNKKWSLSFLFLLGAFVCVASIFRIIAVKEIDPLDFTFTNVGGGLWSTVEVEIGFICANLPAIRPLIFKVFKIQSTTVSASRGPSGYGGMTGKRGIVSRTGHMTLSSKGRDTDLEMMSKNNGSDEIELTSSSKASVRGDDRGNGIRVQTDVEMQVDDWQQEERANARKAQEASQYGKGVKSFVKISSPVSRG